MSKIYLLNNQKHEGVENIEVFKIEYLKQKIDLSLFDALIFTSKNAVYSINSFNTSWKEIPSFVIAEKTSKIVKNLGGNVSFIGDCKSGDEFARKIINQLKNKKVLYLRAEKIVSNLVDILKASQIDISELITYRTRCNYKLNIKIENNSTIIFTSPSSVDCFFKKFNWNSTLKAVVIGQTTAKYLPNDINYKISDKTSVEECIKLAKLVTF